MKRNLSVLLFLALMAASSATTFAQEIELVYTKANLAQVLDYKAEVTYSDAKATNALSLMNVSPERAGAYVNTTASHDAVIIFGESAVKAVGAIAYTAPVIIINATGKTAAKGPVFRVFDADFAGAASNATTVSDVAGFSLSTADVKSGKEASYRCQGVDMVRFVDKLVSEIAKMR